MQRVLVVALLAFFAVQIAQAVKCYNGCCGLVIATFGSQDITAYFASQNGYFANESVTVCYVSSSSSVDIYDNLLANGTAEMATSQVDNGVWRRMNFGTPLTNIAGNDGQRGFYLVGNTHVLNGYNIPIALSNKNIVVDSVDSGFVVGLRKTLYDYGVTNFTFVPYGTNRLGLVTAGNLNGIPIAATMQNQIAPYLINYPVVQLAEQSEHFCPTQGTGYITSNAWINNPDNLNYATRFLKALIRSYIWQLDPANKPAVLQFISTSAKVTDPNLLELIYDDYYNNPATGLNPYLTPRKAGLRNGVSTRVELGMSPYPAEGVESFITDKVDGFVDLRALKAAQASFGYQDDYDTNDGLEGCPINNHGPYIVARPPLTCAAYYQIDTQPPQWPTGLSASITVYVNNASLLVDPSGNPAWTLSFTATGNVSTPAFQITSNWNSGSVSSTTSGTQTTYTITNADYNEQSPSNIGFNAATTFPSPGNNICGVTLNGVACTITSPATASATC